MTSRRLSADHLEGLVAAVQELKDKAEIREVIDRYWFGEDRFDPEIVASAFTPDAHYGKLQGRDAIRKVMESLSLYESMQHSFASSNIRVDGDAAEADTMAIGFNVGPDADGDQRVLVRGLRYLDQLVRTEDGWQIAQRTGADAPDHGHDTYWQFEGVVTPVWHPKPR
jgi:uncharacterized protein (TIGR02246 family)